MPASISLAAVRILRPLRVTPEGGSTSPDPADPITLCNEFDRKEAVEDLQNQLQKAGYTDVVIVPVSLKTMAEVADRLQQETKELQGRGQDLVVFQLCDGTEMDGYPGVSMVQELEKRAVAFTGSDSAFYIISSSKPILKRELQAASVPTSSFQEFKEPPAPADFENIIQEIGFPMIVKPSISYASIDITMASVVHNPEQLLEQVHKSLASNHASGGGQGGASEALSGSNNHPAPAKQSMKNAKVTKKDKLMEIDIETPTVFVEKFLGGREYTALVIGDKDWGVRVYPVAERAFDPKLGKYERLLAFDQYWDGYDLQGGQGNEDFCKYEFANAEWQDALQKVARDAYLALDGNGYGRVDIRTVEMDTCEPVVLEVNANCGLSFEKDSSSLANILLMSHVDPPEFVKDLVDFAIHRNKRLNGGGHAQRVHRPTPQSARNGPERVEVLARS